MILNEIFNSSHPYEWVETSANKMVATFTAGDTEFHVVFAVTEGTNDMWWFTFEDKAVPDDQKFTKTGKGNEMLVFKAVVAIASEFVTQKRPKILYFSGNNDEGRGPLYTKLIQMVLKRHSNAYHLEEEPVDDRNKFGKQRTNSTAYLIVRNR